MKFRHNHPSGAIDLPELGLVNVQPGAVIEVTGDAAQSLLKQSTWTRVDEPDPKRVEAAKQGANKTEESK